MGDFKEESLPVNGGSFEHIIDATNEEENPTFSDKGPTGVVPGTDVINGDINEDHEDENYGFVTKKFDNEAKEKDREVNDILKKALDTGNKKNLVSFVAQSTFS